MDIAKSKTKNALFIGGMVLAWAGYYLASNWTVGYTGSAFVAGLVLRGAAFVWLSVYVVCKKELRALFRQGKVTWILLFIGLLGYMLDTFANIGFQHGSVSTGTVLLKTDILMANIATAVFLKQKLHASDWAATAIMFAGVILVLNIDYANFSFNWYDLFFIASAVSVTANAFVIKGVQEKFDVPSDVIAYYNNFVVMILFLVSALISGDIKNLGNINLGWQFWLVVVAGGLAQSLIYVFYYRNLKVFPVWEVKLFLLFVPIISCIVGVLAFDEGFDVLQGVGIGLVLVGAVIILLRDKLNKKHLAKHGKNAEDKGEKEKEEADEKHDVGDSNCVDNIYDENSINDENNIKDENKTNDENNIKDENDLKN